MDKHSFTKTGLHRHKVALSEESIFSKYKASAALAALCLVLTAGPAWTGTVTDEIGRAVNIPDNPGRIIALTPSLTEILFALGLGSKVVGATTWADYPPEGRKLPRVGAYVSPNLEQLVALAPDLVLVSREGNPPWVLDKLEEAGIPVYVHWPGDPIELPQSLARIGAACGVPERGRVLAEEMRARFETVMARLKGVRFVSTLMVIGNRPLVSVSPESFHGRLLTMVRARNVAGNARGRWPRLSLEYVLEAQPEVVVVSTMERGQNLERELKFWRELPGLAGRPGFRVAGVTSDLIDRPGPRLGLGLELLARIVHPGRFGPKKEDPK